MIAEIKVRLIVREDIYEIIKSKISSMDKENHALVMEILLYFFEYDIINTISWKFNDEIYVKKYNDSLIEIDLEVISTEENWNPIIMIFHNETNLWEGLTDIRNSNLIKSLLTKTNKINKN